MPPRTLIFPLLLLAPAACDGPVATGCPAIEVPRFWVTVTDSLTGAAVAGALVTDSLTGGSLDDLRFASRNGVSPDSALTQGTGTADVGGRGGGRFTVSVSAAGYRLWRRTKVRVDADALCGLPRTVLITARLVPARSER